MREQLENGNMRVVEYTSWNFLTELQATILDGYRLSSDVAHYPEFGHGFYSATLVKETAPVEKTKTARKPKTEETTNP